MKTENKTDSGGSVRGGTLHFGVVVIAALLILVMMGTIPTGMGSTTVTESASAGTRTRSGSANPSEYFRIQVIDRQTKRGVPLVALTTTNEITWVTDSAGMIAFNEPGLMNRDVYFSIKSHGYSYPKDGFGLAGVRLHPAAGKSATIEMDRVNIAERLYRETGEGIYNDSILLGDKVPIEHPVMSDGGVMGQDSALNVIYKGKLFWIWGDTGRASYPLGNFHCSGAVSLLPADSPARKTDPEINQVSGVGLDPSTGINFHYFTGHDGFCKGMFPVPSGTPGPIWIDGLIVRPGEDGRGERILCHWMRVKDLGVLYEQGFGVYNDEKEIFESIKTVPLDVALTPSGHPIRMDDSTINGNNRGAYWYFMTPYPSVRVRDAWDAYLDPTQYEAMTPLKPGTKKFDAKDPENQIERDAQGNVIYTWKADTAVLNASDEQGLIKKGLLKASEAHWIVYDADKPAQPVLLQAGTISYNPYRKMWIMIAQQVWGTSMVGETWYVQAQSPMGPWSEARKIVTHDDYSFYNVTQHPYFAQAGGRYVYFEGTYTKAFSGTKIGTPRYDYNQMMYRLDLSDPRLALPVHSFLESGGGK